MRDAFDEPARRSRSFRCEKEEREVTLRFVEGSRRGNRRAAPGHLQIQKVAPANRCGHRHRDRFRGGRLERGVARKHIDRDPSRCDAERSAQAAARNRRALARATERLARDREDGGARSPRLGSRPIDRSPTSSSGTTPPPADACASATAPRSPGRGSGERRAGRRQAEIGEAARGRDRRRNHERIREREKAARESACVRESKIRGSPGDPGTWWRARGSSSPEGRPSRTGSRAPRS